MLGVAIQGAGNVSTEHIKAYQNNPNTQVVAIGSRTLESAERKAKQLNLDCELFDNYLRLLENPKVDVVSICTPPDRHAEESIAAAKAGKHLLIEKPVAINKTELQAMYETISQAKIKTVISFVLRWNPLILSIKEIVAKGWVGTPLLVQADYWHGPTNINPKRFHKKNWVPMNIGAIVHGGCHAMDAARYVLCNAKIVQVSGTMPTYSVPSHIIKPLTMASVKFENGAIGKISGSTTFFMPYVFNIEVFGDEGVIRNNQFYSKQVPGQRNFGSFPTILPDSGDVSHHPFQDTIDHLIDCILTDTESHNSLSVAANTHLACFEAEESSMNNSSVISITEFQ